VPDETFGYGLEIVVDERKKAEPGNEYESPLQGLEYGDEAHTAGNAGAGAGLWIAQFLSLRRRIWGAPGSRRLRRKSTILEVGF
jgi:hypothetical protein